MLKTLAVTVTTATVACVAFVILREILFPGNHEPKQSKQERRQERNERRRARIDARKKQKQVQMNAERQHRWELETALHPIDQDEKQRLYEAKLARKQQQQEELEDRLNMAMAIGLRIVVDLDFLNHQTLRERNSVFKQVATVYGTMKKSTFPNLLSLHLASYCGDVAAFCDQRGARSWKVSRHEQPIHDLFPNDTVVFLSPDAPTVLNELDPNTVYVIGGIVDRTVRKSQTLAKASASAIRTARLPVQEHLRVKSHVLNIDTVLLILLHVHNHGDWKEAFEAVLPKRFRRAG